MVRGTKYPVKLLIKLLIYEDGGYLDKALPSVPTLPPGPVFAAPSALNSGGCPPARRTEGNPLGRRHPPRRAGGLHPCPVRGRGSGCIAGRKRKAAGELRRAGEEPPPAQPARSIPKGGLLAGTGDPPQHPAGPAQPQP